MPCHNCEYVILIGGIMCAFLAIILLALLQPNSIGELRPREGYVFDYVIVGAGTTGCVAASVLTLYSNSTVLLVEAGGQFGLLSKIPLFTTFQQQGPNDWNFQSEPQTHSSAGLKEKRQNLARGKGLGGSSELNYMLHYHGEPTDFDSWVSQFGLTDWSWKSMQPYIKGSFAKPDEMLEISGKHSRIAEAFFDAQNRSLERPWKFHRARYNVKNGLRWSVFQRFLKPALKTEKLRIMKNTLVKRILFDEIDDTNLKQVLGITVGDKRNAVNGGEAVFKVLVRKELILAGGAFQTPQLLQVSGIGDDELLECADILVEHSLPNVGRHLHDHINFPLFVSIDVVGPSLNQKTLLDPMNIIRYLFNGGGPYGNFGVIGHIDCIPHHYGITIFGAGAIDEYSFMSISNFKQYQFRALFPRHENSSQEGFVAIATCIHPRSRGKVTVRSWDMRHGPSIDPRYLSDSADVDCLIRGIRAVVALVTSESFANLGPHIHWPRIPQCLSYWSDDVMDNCPSDIYLECIIRHVALTSHHPGGTCRMGSSANNSVVDSKMRVHGFKNLRIVDASILPTPLSGYPNSILMAIALKGASMILADEI